MSSTLRPDSVNPLFWKSLFLLQETDKWDWKILDPAPFAATISSLRAEVGLLKKQGASRGSMSCFQDLLSGIQSLEDVQSWVVANFEGASGAGGGADLDSRIWGEMEGSGADGPTFGAFCDIYVLLATAKDLDSVLFKGDTLKEMDHIQKAGINHPAEAVVIYSLKRAVPRIFGIGMGSGGTLFLPKTKDGC
jgi:hypothetical protein